MSETVLGLRRSSSQTLTGVQIIGTGSYVPDNVVTNADLARLGCDADWIFQRTGIRERRHAPDGMATAGMATAAAERALQAADVDRDTIDLLVVGTFTPDKLVPQTAATVQNSLGLNCGAVDLGAACAGFMYALVTGAQFIATGSARRVLVVGADTNTRVVDANDKKTYPLFGDGAGAVVLAPGNKDQGMLAYTLGCDGAGAELLHRPMGGTLEPYDPSAEPGRCMLKMEGKAVFKWAVRLLEDSFNQVLEAAGLKQDAVKLWVLHQANARILDAASDAMGIPSERVVKNLDRYGNTSAGSIPIGLDESFRAGQIEPGDELMLCGFGAGLSWGTALWRW